MKKKIVAKGSTFSELAVALNDVRIGSRKRSTAIQRALAVTKENVQKMREARS